MAARADAEDEPRPGKDAPLAGRVSRIAPQRRDPDRVNVYLDDVFAFGLDASIVLESGLHAGQQLSEAETLELRDGDEIRRATSAAVQFLGYRARSEREICDRLRRRGFADAAIEATLTRLRDWHYVDDQDFAGRWVDNRLQHRPRSTRLLTQELLQHGIDRDTAQQVVTDAEVDEQADAITLARERAERLRTLDPAVRDRRIAALLGRRGYGWDVIRTALRALEEEREEAQDTERSGSPEGSDQGPPVVH